jgi:hypothetical protein
MVMIKQVIDGKTYNTETARCLATVDLMGYRTDEPVLLPTPRRRLEQRACMKPVAVRTSWYAITTPVLVSMPSRTLSGSLASMIAV